MPQIGLRHTFEMPTRNNYTKVNAEIGLKLDGRELPNTAVLGEALDKAVEMIEEHIKQSYKVVPERHGDTPSGVKPHPADNVARGVVPEPPAPAVPNVPDFG